MTNTVGQKNSIAKQHECLIILAMHHSGGSLLAGCFYHLGINLGTNLTGHDDSSGQCDFVNQDILLTHEILFRDLGCRWDMVGRLPDGWQESKAANRATQRLVQILQRQFLDQELWAINDPRLCRLMPLWSDILKNLNIKPRFIYLLRHPYEVAFDLQRHRAFGLSKGHMLWLAHHRDALQVALRNPHVVATYDQLLSDPVSTLLKISSAVDFDLPRDPMLCAPSLTELVQPAFKRHKERATSASKSPREYASYAWVYDQFCQNQIRGTEPQSGFDEVQNLRSLSHFPLPPVNSESVYVTTDARNHANDALNQLLSLIGRYEQIELDQQQQRQRRLLNSTDFNEILFTQVYLPVPDDEHVEYNE
jgi:hypothetical protein